MNSLFGFLFSIAALATVLVLVVGIISFAMNGPFYQRHSNHLMRLRVLFQAIAILFLAISVWAWSN